LYIIKTFKKSIDKPLGGGGKIKMRVGEIETKKVPIQVTLE